MTGPRCTAVLDIGKTNVRLCAVQDDRTFETLSAPNHGLDGPPYPHYDVDAIFEWTCEGLRSLSAELSIKTLVTTTHGATAALVCGDRLALPVLDYEFAGVGEIEGRYPRPDFEETLSPRLPAGLNLGRQLFWQERSFPLEWGEVTDILMYPQYWAWRFSGVKAAELTSLGCHTDLWSPGQRRFSTLTRERGWEEKFPTLEPAWKRLGTLSPSVAARVGLGRDCEVICGIHDSNAAYLVHRLTRDDRFAVLSTGTWAVAMAAGAPVSILREELDTLANVDAFGNPVPCSRFMGGREYHAIAGTDGLAVEARVADLERVIASRTMALPGFAPQGGPFRDHPGRIEGDARRAPRNRAALASLYCALMADYCLELIRAEGDLIIEGSFATNTSLCGTLAALRAAGRTWASDDVTGTAGGAARLADLDAARRLVPALRPCPPLELAGLREYRSEWRRRLPRPERR